MKPQSCPKCQTEMEPGFPVEIGAKGHIYVTGWSNEMPREVAKLFGGSVFLGTQAIEHRLMGFACPQCGFVELYRVTNEQLQRFLNAQQG